MSELTYCNYCNLRNIKALAKGKKERVVLSSAGSNLGLGGVNVISYSKELNIPKKGTQERVAFEKKYFVAWFMELTNYCCC